MFTNVIVGIDGRDGGQDALALGARLVGENGRLVLAHIFCPDSQSWSSSGGSTYEASRRRALDMLETVRRDAQPRSEARLYDALDPGRGLHELAEALDADLIVVGSCRRGVWGRVLTADHTLRALDGAPCAVAVAPRGYTQVNAAMRRIGVAYDGSIESEHALGFGRKLAADNRATLAVCEVIYLPARLYVGLLWPEAPSVDQIIRDAEARLGRLHGVEPHAACGDPPAELARFSEQFDLLVLGSRSYGAWGRLLYGHTARDLSRLSRCPLLVLTRGAREQQANEVLLESEHTTRV